MTDVPARKTAPSAFKSARSSRAPRQGAKAQSGATGKTPTKLAVVTELLARPAGASLEELCAATGWQPHSVRGAIAGSLKRKGLVVTSERKDGIRRYRIGAAS